MKKIFTLFFILSSSLLFIECKPQVPDFAGVWETGTATSEFTLTLSQNNKALSGSHCSVQKSGDKIDCGIDAADLSISGTVGDSATVLVKFKSHFKNLSGTASIKKLSATVIEWKILQKPKGEFYIPMQAILTKE